MPVSAKTLSETWRRTSFTSAAVALSLFTTKPEEERSGMGFTFMEIFMDRLEVESAKGKGTSVHMVKKIGGGK